MLAEVDRYTPGALVVQLDPAALQRRVTVYLELDQLASGLDALAGAEGLNLVRLGPVTLVRSKGDAAPG